jgi:hippurate hydrolase
VSLLDEARRLQPDLVTLRRALHRSPEIGLDLPLTQATILEALAGLDLEIRTGQGCSSIVAVLRGGATVPEYPRTVLLRADMDALPITEESEDPDLVSQIDGVMHACGHDLHSAMLVGAARLLSARRTQLAGDVVFMFQPGEEGFGGAQIMLDEGVLEAAGRRPDSAWALHVLSGRMPQGIVTGMPGATMSASNELHVRVRGVGGHGAAPHKAKDPVPVAAEMVLGLQTLLTRTTSPFDPAVLTVGLFHAGTKANVIPEQATFAATIRTFNDAIVEQLAESTVRYCEGVARAHGLLADAEFVRQYPVTMNDATAVDLARNVVSRTLGEKRWNDLQTPSSGAEDFSLVLQSVPGAMLFLGASMDGDGWASSPENHSPRSRFDESVMPDGAAVLAGLAIQSLKLET